MSKVYVFNGLAARECVWSRCRFGRERIFSHLEQLDAVPESVLDNAGDMVLVGWSMGGSSALRMALRYPGRIKGLVLLAATARMMADGEWRGMSKLRLNAFKCVMMMPREKDFFGGQGQSPDLYDLEDEVALGRGLAYLEHTDIRNELRAAGAEGLFRFPVHIYQSERDGIVRPENAAFLRAIFPRAKFEMIPGSEHVLPLSIASRIDASVASMSAD